MKNPALVLVSCLLMAALACADGAYFSNSHVGLSEPDQKAVIVWDGETETMVLSAGLQADDIAKYAWVVPIQSSEKPEVEEGDITIFWELDYYFRARPPATKGWAMTAGVQEAGGVAVIEYKELGIYDITILKATESRALMDWLNENGFLIPDEATRLFDRYVDKGDMYFVANKIDLENVYKDDITELNYIYADLFDDEGFGVTLSQKIADIKQKVGYGHEYYDKFHELETTISNMKTGFGTPLKFIFKPPSPNFPLAISSLGTGYTRVDVFVLTSGPVTDKNGVLDVKDSKAIDAQLTQDLRSYLDLGGARYATKLAYYGNLQLLNDDAEFRIAPNPSDLILLVVVMLLIIVALFISALTFMEKKKASKKKAPPLPKRTVGPKKEGEALSP